VAWVRFSRDFDWPPLASAHVAYRAGMRCNVPAACAEAAIADGAAAGIRTPPRAQAAQLKADPFWTEPAPHGDHTSPGG
jgi:hypothetical protein